MRHAVRPRAIADQIARYDSEGEVLGDAKADQQILGALGTLRAQGGVISACLVEGGTTYQQRRAVADPVALAQGGHGVAVEQRLGTERHDLVALVDAGKPAIGQPDLKSAALQRVRAGTRSWSAPTDRRRRRRRERPPRSLPHRRCAPQPRRHSADGSSAPADPAGSSRRRLRQSCQSIRRRRRRYRACDTSAGKCCRGWPRWYARRSASARRRRPCLLLLRSQRPTVSKAVGEGKPLARRCGFLAPIELGDGQRADAGDGGHRCLVDAALRQRVVARRHQPAAGLMQQAENPA